MTITSYNPNFIYIIIDKYLKNHYYKFYKFYNGKVYKLKETLELAIHETNIFGAPTTDNLSYLKLKDVVAIYTPDLHPELFL